ncbi:hypothetical protein BU25DRAFT_156216 [Macroventuria anomochaeta]|uniref:Uncharacterized protein n=1 Tax=Macroventuria anomochaeta TaxID=301207 RepID=A0ACB6RRD9_9PLEO|nr:uncharacterized protein BU25DRAFT_156216 [Macroventuria anomochaeta]KAF2624606.1 hypothetical protein BU25DRAFT_156216 [Macroventuria anomochaeta]
MWELPHWKGTTAYHTQDDIPQCRRYVRILYVHCTIYSTAWRYRWIRQIPGKGPGMHNIIISDGHNLTLTFCVHRTHQQHLDKHLPVHFLFIARLLSGVQHQHLSLRAH